MSNRERAKRQKRERGWLTWRQAAKAGLLKQEIKVPDGMSDENIDFLIKDQIKRISRKTKYPCKAHNIMIFKYEPSFSRVYFQIQ